MSTSLALGGRARKEAGPQSDQLVEGSALGVPLEEVGLGEQWELLLALLPALGGADPATRWTTGFCANSTPAGGSRGEERRQGPRCFPGCSLLPDFTQGSTLGGADRPPPAALPSGAYRLGKGADR